MSKKRRKTLHLNQDEIAVVGTVDKWEHLSMVYGMLAEDAPVHEIQFWRDAQKWIDQYLIEYETSRDEGYYGE